MRKLFRLHSWFTYPISIGFRLLADFYWRIRKPRVYRIALWIAWPLIVLTAIVMVVCCYMGAFIQFYTSRGLIRIIIGRGAFLAIFFPGAYDLGSKFSMMKQHESVLLTPWFRRDPITAAIPLWLVVVALACIILYLRMMIRRKEHLPGRCKDCGYDLTGNVSGKCPECGCATKPVEET